VHADYERRAFGVAVNAERLMRADGLRQTASALISVQQSPVTLTPSHQNVLDRQFAVTDVAAGMWVGRYLPMSQHEKGGYTWLCW